VSSGSRFAFVNAGAIGAMSFGTSEVQKAFTM